MRYNRFDLSHYNLTTCDMGQLVPVGLTEILPGDIMRAGCSHMVRLSPMAAPVMHRIRVRLDTFFIPTRLVWNESLAGVSWEDFITGGEDGKDASKVPSAQFNTRAAGDVLDHLGVPPVTGLTVATMPPRAYNLVYNEWYRDQDLAPEAPLGNTEVKRIAWAKDYLTTSRSSPQKGDAVTLPIAGTAPVKGIGKIDATFTGTSTSVRETGGTSRSYQSSALVQGSPAGDQFHVEQDPDNPGYPGVYADLAAATPVSVTDLRLALALQRFLENRQRFGSRYVEYCMRLGARPLDARVQRPEYLGGSRTTVSVSEILQTAPETGQTPSTQFGVGDLYGHGISVGRRGAWARRFEEHGYVLTLLSVRPEALYQDGVARHFLYQTREDYFQPELAFIGQQQVSQSEVYAQPGSNETVFGWADRHHQYRSQMSQVAGEFRTDLDYWHFGRKFSSAPALNQTFVECDPSKRPFNVQSRNTLWCAVQHRKHVLRRIPRQAVPRIL